MNIDIYLINNKTNYFLKKYIHYSMKQIQGSGSGSKLEQNGSETLIIILLLSLFMYDIAPLF